MKYVSTNILFYTHLKAFTFNINVQTNTVHSFLLANKLKWPFRQLVLHLVVVQWSTNQPLLSVA